MFEEFKKFILKGNVLDMAVGIVIGAAFGTVVKSFVDNIMMPPIGKLMNNVDFSDMSWKIGEKTVGEGDDAKVEVIAINYGQFINDFISLVIIGFCVFMLVRTYNKAKEKFEKVQEEVEEAAPKISGQEKLLTEIRDLLGKK